MPKVKTNINLDLDVKMSFTRQNVLHADTAATASENYMSDSELLAISDKLTKKNKQAYEVLAK